MEAIRPLWDQMPLTQFQPRQNAVEGASFTDIFKSAVEAVRESDAENVNLQYLMATGQLDNPALLTIAAAKMELSVDLLVQLRNKAMDAYSELTRISL